MLPFTHKQTHAWKYTLVSVHVSVAHAPSAADSRALSPITTERGSTACWEQTIWGICQVLVDSKQSTVKNTLPWLGSLLPTLLFSACSKQCKPPSPRWNLSSSVLFCSAAQRSLPLHTAAPISAASTDLPARLERAPQHPGDQVRSHYLQWEKLLGHGWKGKIRRTSRIRTKRTCAVACFKQIVRLKDSKRFWKLVRARVS